jgi:monolysocardiolipin acyltransferase
MGLLTALGISALVYTGVIALAVQSAIYYRPVPDYTGTGGEAGMTKMREMAVDRVPLALQVARFITVSLISALCRMLMGLRNRVELVQDDNYKAMLRYWRRRPRGTGLITVSNHASSLDDPALLAAISPYDVLLQPSRMRWSIATQDLVFPKGKTWIQAFMGAGQTLPIWRGGGIDQPLLLDMARQLAAGNWAHIFPEARVVQSGDLGQDPITKRSEDELRRIGLLKWGVGKLIAHAPVEPIVVPFYHFGMVGVLPQHNKWVGDRSDINNYHNLVIDWLRPGKNQTVKVWFGERLYFDDLIAAHEAKHGPLHKVTAAPIAGSWQQELEKWKSSESDRELYHQLTDRIEEALLGLESRAKKDAQENPVQNMKLACERCLAATPKGKIINLRNRTRAPYLRAQNASGA